MVSDNSVSDDQSKKTSGGFREALQWIEAIVFAVVIALLIRGFVFEPVEVKGHSMQDTLLDKQRLILYKLGYYFVPPSHGDIIVIEVKEGFFKNIPLINNIPFIRKAYSVPEEIDYIKRVIGVPGDTINLKDGYVYVNDVKLDEPYAKGMTYKITVDFPVRVPENKVFVLGDNRENSSDSRVIGLVDFSKIKGRAVFRIYPLQVMGKVN